MTQQELVKLVAYQIYSANGKQDGFAEWDYRQAQQLVNENWGNGQRCVRAQKRDGTWAIVTLSPGHSSY